MTEETWTYIHKGSEEYINKIGLFRTLYKLTSDPNVVAFSSKGQVKIKLDDTPWEFLK